MDQGYAMQDFENAPENKVKGCFWDYWSEINKYAIDAYNERVALLGLPLAKYRTWGKNLDAGLW
jgi:antitoxin CcdA